MKRYLLSPRAQKDLEEIWNYSVKIWGVDQAETYLRQIQKGIEIVVRTPEVGRSCDHIREGYRKFPAGSHVVFYRMTKGKIDIVRILHERMDIGRQF